MSSYVESHLLTEESLLYMGRISLWPYTLRLIFGAICLTAPLGLQVIPWLWPLGIALMIIGFFLWTSVIVVYQATELAVTNKRIIVKLGVIRRATTELYLTRIEGVEVEQSILGRMLGYGTVYVRGIGTEIAPVSNISNPLGFRKAFFEAADLMLEAQPGKSLN